jgi:hypothetical protein
LATALAQNAPSRIAPACGLPGVDFHGRLDKSQHTIISPQPGKAQVYFVQDKGPHSFGVGGTVVSWIGIDGQWVGMNKNNSYFSVPLEPGEHHICAFAEFPSGDPVELSYFKAEAGNVYYFRERIIPTEFGIYLLFDPVNSDEAKYLVGAFPLSISHPRTKKG